MADKQRTSVRQFLRLYGLYARMDFAWLLRDTRFALLSITADMISNVASVTGIFLLAWRFDGIGGMNRYEVLLMLGYFTMLIGLFQLLCCGENNGHISRRIGRGQIEHMMLQPVPYGLQLAKEGFLPFSGSGGFLSGVAILATALHFLELRVTVWWVLSLLGNLAVSLILLLALLYLASSVTFYAPVQAEEITSYVYDTAGELAVFPLGEMPLGLRIPMLALFPAGCMAWLPTMQLLGRPPFYLSGIWPVLAALLFTGLAAYFFRKGWRYYVKKGSCRYSTVGFRR